MQQSPNPQPGVPPPPFGAGDPRSIVFYVETFLGIVESGTTGQVYSFWLQVIRTELQAITDEPTRNEALRLLQEVDKVGHWFAHEARRPGEALPMIVTPIRNLMDYLRQSAPKK
jgi:hypothetical protein